MFGQCYHGAQFPVLHSQDAPHLRTADDTQVAAISLPLHKAEITRFVISPTGNLQFTGNNVLTTLTSAATSAQTITFPNLLVLSVSHQATVRPMLSGAPTLGSIVEGNIMNDLLIGRSYFIICQTPCLCSGQCRPLLGASLLLLQPIAGPRR